jgi:outer membrane murein-binding lipoprotein Lpp
MKRNLSITALLIASLSLLGCTTNQLSTDLSVVADASTAATVVLTGLSIAGVIPPAVADRVVTYLQQVNAAIPDVQKELNSTDPLPQKITVISAALSKYIAVDIPGLPPGLQTLVTSIGDAIQLLLTHLKASTPAVAKAKANLKRLAEYRAGHPQGK